MQRDHLLPDGVRVHRRRLRPAARRRSSASTSASWSRARATTRCPTPTPRCAPSVDRAQFTSHFHEVFEQIDRDVKRAVRPRRSPTARTSSSFVYAKLKLRCYEIFQSFDDDNQRGAAGDDRRADLRRRQRPPRRGEVPRRARRRCSTPRSARRRATSRSSGARRSRSRRRPHARRAPTTTRSSQRSSTTTPPIPSALRKQAEADLELHRARRWPSCDEQRARRRAASSPASSNVAELAGGAPFLDGHVYVHPARARPRATS